MQIPIHMIKVIEIILNIYFALMLVYIFATWIPNVDWEQSPWKYLKKVVYIYLGIFEKYIPGWGSVIGIIVYRFLQNYFHLHML